MLRGTRPEIAFDRASGRAINAVCSPLVRLSPVYDGNGIGDDL